MAWFYFFLKTYYHDDNGTMAMAMAVAMVMVVSLSSNALFGRQENKIFHYCFIMLKELGCNTGTFYITKNAKYFGMPAFGLTADRNWNEYEWTIGSGVVGVGLEGTSYCGIGREWVLDCGSRAMISNWIAKYITTDELKACSNRYQCGNHMANCEYWNMKRTTQPLLPSISNNKTHIFPWLLLVFSFSSSLKCLFSLTFDIYIEQERTNKNHLHRRCRRCRRRCNHSFNSIKYRHKHLISTRSYFK